MVHAPSLSNVPERVHGDPEGNFVTEIRRPMFGNNAINQLLQLRSPLDRRCFVERGGGEGIVLSIVAIDVPLIMVVLEERSPS